MRISSRGRGEEGRERITLVPENVDDLWHLSYVLEPGDLVSGDTTRRIQRDDEQMRDTGGEREHLNVTIEVDDVEFARFANRLRVGGVIVSCSREDQLGHHHTLNVEERAEITIEKQFKADQIDRIETAEQAAENPDVAIATVEEGAAYIHTVAQYGTEEYASLTKPTGKGEYARPRSELFDELGSALSHLEVDAIILAGPGFTKNDAMDYFENNFPAVAETIVTTVDTAGVGDRGVHEVLKRGAVDDVQKQTRIAEEANLIDELMENISTGAKAAYGVEQVAEAAEFGAVEHLLLLDSRLRAERQGDGDWDVDVNDIIDSVEQKGGEVTVFSAEFQPGEQLKNLGGIAAVLRYRLQ
ncbi:MULTISPECIES: mRNA surveillance protein pelota [Haloferax]|uniref:Protein pelota homolog n=1 Tax=Haloferax volcanii TaxID=2246 RepID=A0A6C0UWF4_HALVO|nr:MULTISPECIES: mRNA surveillance protein pelota [Haloferax]QIB79885.1 mRNA surveillance protein pelota [Haloferax alexandrinus]RDZ34543.1 mRNA surveillance protein pelota [Haloferax sp. Atlit-24N]RLM34954.1 mRNA surveillance protein pelota [Haloferax sp. Atlit-109R]RLM42807.1 mRNA surveillance protein pelota [Haloferax sp. Atlit-105R]WEL26041.1 mRNA surveillance protein pelota [Haloferax lucentense]